MTELDLYKFISENEVEYHFTYNTDERDDPEVIIFVYLWDLEEFNGLIPESVFVEGGVPCTMMGKYMAIEMRDFCEELDIEIKNVFKDE